MARIDIRGVMVPNDYEFYYKFFNEDCTCPRHVKKVLDEMTDGEDLDVYVNSPGGVIDVGSEIYTLLREVRDTSKLRIHITGEACSAASVAAMAGWCEMSPTALMMVHCVSTRVGGNHLDMEHAAEMLRAADRAMCGAYTAKTGMTEAQAIEMMEHETWLTAAQAKEKGLIDAIMFEEKEPEVLTNAVGLKLPSKEQLENLRRIMESDNAQQEEPDRKREMLAKLKLLNLKK